MTDLGIKVFVTTCASDARALIGDPFAVSTVEKAVSGHAPKISGDKGQAWLCDHMAGLRAKFDDERDIEHNSAVVASYVVEAPWAHPAWHSYWICLVHLRPLPDPKRETIFYLPMATHEFWLYALDPDADRDAIIATGAPFGILKPINFSAQFIEATDLLAIGRIEAAIRDICAGTLTPDVDGRREWVRLFGDNMLKQEYR